MEPRDDLILYLRLSRKELQELCKKHKLPANRSHAELAKSLASHFQNKSTSSPPLKERSSNYASLSTSFVSELKQKSNVTHAEKSSRGNYARTNSLEYESIQLASFTKEKVDDYRRRYLTGDDLEISREMDGRSLKKADDTTLNVVSSHLTNNDSEEGFDHSALYPRDGNRRELIANAQDITTDSQLAFKCSQLACKCHNDISKSGFQNSLEVINSGSKSLSHARTSHGIANLALDPSKHILSDDAYIKAPRLFEFFVMNEGGLNLYVDLNSSPSDWINSMKAEIRINQEADHCKASNLCNHNRSCLNLHDHMKASTSGNIGFDVQNNGLKRSNCCINSSLMPTISDNCHSKVHPADAAVVTSRSAALTSSENSIRTSCYLEETQLFSSSTCSKVQNHMAFNSASFPGLGKMVPQEMEDTSLCTGKIVAPIIDSSLKSDSSLGSLSNERVKNPNAVDCQSLKIARIASSNVGASALDDTLSNISKKEGPPISTGIRDNMEASHVSNMESEFSGYSNRLSNFFKLSGPLSLNCPSTDAQSDMGSAEHLLNHYSCGSLESFVSEDPTLEQLDRGISVKEKESSGYSQIKNYFDKTCKKSRGKEFLEYQSKRQFTNCENKNEALANLRSSKTLDEESVCGSVALPRRSLRLSSKRDEANSTT